MAKKGKKLDVCPNCNQALEPHFEFCPQCGQENHDIQVPIKHIGYEFIEGITHFDTKVFSTLKTMLSKPGAITKDQLEGKRARYVPAPRYYIFISFIFFLIIGNLLDKQVSNIKKDILKNKERLIVKSQNKEFNLTYENWINWLKMDERFADSLLVAEKNSIPSNHDSLRLAVYLSLKKLFTQNPKLSIYAQTYDDENEDEDEENYKDSIVLNFNAKNKPASKQDTNKMIETEISKNQQANLLNLDSIYHKHGKSYRQKDFTYSNSNIFKAFYGVELSPLEVEKMSYASNEELDSFLISKGKKPSFMKRALLKKSKTFNELNFDNLVHTTFKVYNVLLFILMPLIAFLTWVFFRKQRKYYIEHLIYSIHMHSFIFTVYSIFILIYYILSKLKIEISGWLVFFFLLFLMYYFIKSMRVVFEESRLATVFKFFVISSIYFIISSIISGFSLAYAFLI